MDSLGAVLLVILLVLLAVLLPAEEFLFVAAGGVLLGMAARQWALRPCCCGGAAAFEGGRADAGAGASSCGADASASGANASAGASAACACGAGACNADACGAEAYPGALSEADLAGLASSELAAWGHSTEEQPDMPAFGNPARTAFSGPVRREECSGARCPSVQAGDADERLAYQARSRNDTTRSDTGALRLIDQANRYYREELDEEEDTVWWGRDEN